MKTEKKAVPAFIFRIIGLLVGITAITIHMLINSVVDTGFMVKHNLAYFTLQTNIFSSIVFAVLIVKTLITLKKEHCFKIAEINPSVKLAFTFYITVTMLGYWCILAPMTGVPKIPMLFLDTLFLHTLMPLCAILDWIIFSPHGQVKKTAAFKWLIYPVIYLISVIIVSLVIKEPYYTFPMGGEIIELMYPYPFLDPQVTGTAGFIGIVLLLAAFFTLFGLLYVFIDKKLKRKSE